MRREQEQAHECEQSEGQSRGKGEAASGGETEGKTIRCSGYLALRLNRIVARVKKGWFVSCFSTTMMWFFDVLAQMKGCFCVPQSVNGAQVNVTRFFFFSLPKKTTVCSGSRIVGCFECIADCWSSNYSNIMLSVFSNFELFWRGFAAAWYLFFLAYAEQWWGAEGNFFLVVGILF